jgi:hypothetical protein
MRSVARKTEQLTIGRRRVDVSNLDKILYPGERDNRDKWRLIKTGRNTRAVSQQRDDESALTKRTMAQIAAARDAVWQSNRK